MNKTITDHAAHNGSLHIGNGGLLGHSYYVWRRLQHGQEQVIRWERYRKEFPGKLRAQSGHDHRCSISFLATNALILMRPFIELDELLVLQCVGIHDEPEGILIVDIPADLKTDDHDLAEYTAFGKLYGALPDAVWLEMQKAYLLQFCLKNPRCFPEDARTVMKRLEVHRHNEALFFDAIQRLDYLYYAYECHVERAMTVILERVVTNHIAQLDNAARILPGFKEAVWNREKSAFFAEFFKGKENV